MRFASLVVVLAFAGTSAAQGNSSTGSNIWGGAPKAIVPVPIDTSKALALQNSSKALRTPSSKTNSPFNVSGIFHSISLPTFPPKAPQVSVLPQAQNPFQPNGVKGGVNMFNISPNKKK